MTDQALIAQLAEKTAFFLQDGHDADPPQITKEIRKRARELREDEGWTLREAMHLAIAELGGAK